MNKKTTTYHSNLGKLPPQAVELEEVILGALMIESNKDTKFVLNYLKDIEFYKESHQIIFKQIQDLVFNNCPVDIRIVTQKLKDIGKLEKVGGGFYIANLTSKVASSGNIVFHARIIKQKFMQRELIRICEEVSNKAFDSTEDVFDLYKFADIELKNMYSYLEERSKVVIAKDATKSFLEEGTNEEIEKYIWETSYKRFNEIIGICKNKILMIAGAAKHGKSKFVTSIMFDLLANHNDISIYWVTLEDSAKDIIATYLSSKIHVKPKYIRQRRYNQDQFEQIKKELEVFNKFDIDFIEQTTKASELRASFSDFCKIRKDRLCILIIDNILSLSDREDFKGNDNGMYDYIMGEILRIRQETQQLIIPIHHYKDAQQSLDRVKTAYRPVLGDMKGTEAFRRTPNQVLLLNNPGKYKDIVEEYKDKKDLLKHIFICDTGANRDDSSDDDNALIHFVHSLDYNIFEEL